MKEKRDMLDFRHGDVGLVRGRVPFDARRVSAQKRNLAWPAGSSPVFRLILLPVALMSLAGGDTFAQTVADLFQKAAPAVVTIRTPSTLASGFVVGSDGVIVTNYHVISGANQAQVRVGQDTYAVAGVLAYDVQRDFAVIKIPAFGLPVLRLGNSNDVTIGQPVIAIGNPEGFERTVSNGILSQRRQMKAFLMLQHTAPISHGSSGGPLLDMSGKVIGINTLINEEGQNLNFALPIDYVREVLDGTGKITKALPELAKEQEALDQKERIAEIEANFEVHKDVNGLFEMLVPKAWRVEAAETERADGSREFYTMFAPPSAARREIKGYMSEGIRVSYTMSPVGKVWPESYRKSWVDAFPQQIIKANAGFVIVEDSVINGGRRLTMVGENRNIPEPEKDVFVLLPSDRFLITFEMVSPASKFKEYEPWFNMLFESFINSLQIKSDTRSATPQQSAIPASDTTPFHFKFTNNCRRPIKLAVVYRNLQGDWKDVGWWEFAPRETALLNASNAPLTTHTAVWYYYAVTTDGSWEWAGKERYKVQGETFRMRKIEREGEKEWSISCNAQSEKPQ